jgi:uncharacterized protein (TIGR02145 family)
MKKVNNIFTLFTIVCFGFFSSFNYDSDKIKTIKVGKQVWMVDNLNADYFQNGDLIQDANSDEEWKKAAANHTPAWCYYEQNAENGKKFGKLYNWYAVTDSRGIAPKGFHIPNSGELNQMVKYFGDFKQFTWDSISKVYKCNPYFKIDFPALPGGGRGGAIQSGETQFRDLNKTAIWWSTTEQDLSRVNKNYAGKFASACSFYTKMVPDRDNIPRVVTNIEILPYLKDNGYSVRCIKD